MNEKVKRVKKQRDGWVPELSEIVVFSDEMDWVEGKVKGFCKLQFGDGVILANGNVNKVIPLKASLKGKLSNEDIGNEIGIEYCGKKKSKVGQMYDDFIIYRRPETVF